MCEIADGLVLCDIAITDDDLLSSYHPTMSHYIDRWIEFKTDKHTIQSNHRENTESLAGSRQNFLICSICNLRFKHQESLNYHHQNTDCKNGTFIKNGTYNNGKYIKQDMLNDEQKEALRNYLNYGCVKAACTFRSNYKGMVITIFYLFYKYMSYILSLHVEGWNILYSYKRNLQILFVF